jgi:60 kDa SS-A/Ro ribonucleoprotein
VRTNVAVKHGPVTTHEGAVAQRNTPLGELKRTVMTCLLYEDTFYEKGNDVASRIADLCTKVKPDDIAALAVRARNDMKLRHAPLFLVAQLSKHANSGSLVAATLAEVIQRADELAEFVSIYWQHGARSGKPGKHPLAAGVKRGLAEAFRKFNAYSLAKYNRDSAVRLRDVLFLVHGKPKDDEQASVWKRLVDKTLESPDTWEVALSAGADKKETFERLMREKKLGGMAVLRNLRNMIQAKVDESLIRERLADGCGMALPFRFVTAARYAPSLEDAIEQAMLKAVEGVERLPGKTGLLVDVSGSMDCALSSKAETTRVDVASGLAILLREKAEQVCVATFSDAVATVPPRRGFALRDAIKQSQPHSATYLAKAVRTAQQHWTDLDRLIVITDEQSHDGNGPAFAHRNYVINVASYEHGVGNGNGWHTISGWSERVLDYIAEFERESN